MKKSQSFIRLALIAAILITLNILAGYFNGRLDLTQENGFTLTQPTVKEIKSLNDVVFVKVLLDGQFPAGFKRLQKSTLTMLQEFHHISHYLEYKFEDPSAGTTEEINARSKELAKEGIRPTRLNVKTGTESSEKFIYPVAIFNYKNRSVYVNLLENETPGQNPEVTLNNSISLLEYKCANAISKLLTDDKPNIVFTEGHGELNKEQTGDLEKTLRQYYDTGRLNLDSLVAIPYKDTANAKSADILIVAKPQTAFSEKDKFKLDQYVMNGGKVIWLIDKTTASLEGMQATGEMLPLELPLNLDDIFFKYGFRLHADLVVDMQCSHIPLKVGQVGGAPQMELFPWYYFPIVAPASDHPVVKSLDRVNLQFPSSIDTIRTKTNIKKTILLASSERSRLQLTPTKLSFEILRYKPEPDKFNKGNQPLAIMLEGAFPSNYENRVTAEMMQGLQQLHLEYKPLGIDTKMMVVSDGDIARNEYDSQQHTMSPLGYNRFDKYKFANKDFLINAVEYMLDNNGIIEARTKEVKLRLLDTVKADADANFWRGINIGLPLVLLGLFGWGYTWWRKRKYSS